MGKLRGVELGYLHLAGQTMGERTLSDSKFFSSNLHPLQAY